MLSATLTALVFASGAMAADDVASTAHNLSSTSTNDIYTTNTDEVCVFCHTPHHGDQSIGVALWNRKINTSGYVMYDSTTIEMTIASQPQSVSLACLSCHDGTIAFDSLLNGPGAGDYNGNAWSRGWTWNGSVNKMTGSDHANIGQDLTDDHPVSVTYDNTADVAFYDLATVEGAGLPFYGAGNQLECGTCHNPHNDTYGTFLRMDNAGSALCLTCHIK